MKLLAFSVFDSKAEAYMQPFFTPTKGLAIRMFSELVNEPGHQFNKHCADYTLFHVGQFDVTIGVLINNTEPDNIGNALTFQTSLPFPLSEASEA